MSEPSCEFRRFNPRPLSRADDTSKLTPKQHASSFNPRPLSRADDRHTTHKSWHHTSFNPRPLSRADDPFIVKAVEDGGKMPVIAIGVWLGLAWSGIRFSMFVSDCTDRTSRDREPAGVTKDALGSRLFCSERRSVVVDYRISGSSIGVTGFAPMCSTRCFQLLPKK